MIRTVACQIAGSALMMGQIWFLKHVRIMCANACPRNLFHVIRNAFEWAVYVRCAVCESERRRTCAAHVSATYFCRNMCGTCSCFFCCPNMCGTCFWNQSVTLVEALVFVRFRGDEVHRMRVLSTHVIKTLVLLNKDVRVGGCVVFL